MVLLLSIPSILHLRFKDIDKNEVLLRGKNTRCIDVAAGMSKIHLCPLAQETSKLRQRNGIQKTSLNP